MICIARTFGAPDTVPAGNVARSRSNDETPARSSPATSETRCVMCENRSGLEEALDLHRARHADAREVVAAEVDEHHVLGAVLLGREQPLGVAFAAGAVEPAIGLRLARAALGLHERLRRRADERDPVELEQEEIRRRIDPAQRPIDGERLDARCALGALREDDLERVAAADVLLGDARHAARARPGPGSARSRRSCTGCAGPTSTRACQQRAPRRSGSPASTSAVPRAWSKRTSTSATTKRLSGTSGPSSGSGTVGSSFATWS